MAEEGMVHLIREAGKRPVQRDALYRTVREYARVAEPLSFWLDRFDNGYGRDLSLYFMVRAQR